MPRREHITTGLDCWCHPHVEAYGEERMPLTEKGRKVKAAMEEEYGAKKGESVFYASIHKGTVKGAERGKKRK